MHASCLARLTLTLTLTLNPNLSPSPNPTPNPDPGPNPNQASLSVRVALPSIVSGAGRRVQNKARELNLGLGRVEGQAAPRPPAGPIGQSLPNPEMRCFTTQPNPTQPNPKPKQP